MFVGPDEVTLSSNEFDLLFLLACRAGEIQSRETLYQQLYKRDYDGLDRTPRRACLRIYARSWAMPARRENQNGLGTRLFVRVRRLSMGRHFLQLYFGIVATLAIVSWGQDRLWHLSADSARPDSYPSQAAVLTLVERQLESIPQDRWPAAVAELARSTGLDLELMEPGELTGIETTGARQDEPALWTRRGESSLGAAKTR